MAQFWNGRAADLKAHAGEMAFTHPLAVDLLKSIPGDGKAFNLVFGSDDIDIDSEQR